MASPTVTSSTTSNNDGGNTTSHTLTLPATINAGETIIACFACDGATTVAWPSEGSTWIQLFETTNTGVTLSVAWKKAIGDEDGTNITVTTGASERSSHTSYSIAGATDPTVTPPVQASSVNTGSSTAPDANDCAPGAGTKDYLWLAVMGQDRDDTIDAWPTNYTANQQFFHGTGANSCTIGSATRGTTAASENVTAFTTSTTDEWIAGTIAVSNAVFAPDADAFRFYDDDAGEAASTPLDSEDTNVTIDVNASDTPFQLRFRVQETSGIAGAATDDWQLQFQKNGAGGYANVTGATSNIQTATAGLTNDNATTDRATNGISNGTGSFVAGEQSTDSLVDNMQLTASNYTEHVYGLTMIKADMATTDYVEFQLSTPTGIVNTITPRATALKAFEESITMTSAQTMSITAENVMEESITMTSAQTMSITAENVMEESIAMTSAQTMTMLDQYVVNASIAMASAQTMVMSSAGSIYNPSITMASAQTMTISGGLNIEESISMASAQTMAISAENVLNESITITADNLMTVIGALPQTVEAGATSQEITFTGLSGTTVKTLKLKGNMILSGNIAFKT